LLGLCYLSSAWRSRWIQKTRHTALILRGNTVIVVVGALSLPLWRGKCSNRPTIAWWYYRFFSNFLL
jgi:hypothetical protein